MNSEENSTGAAGGATGTCPVPFAPVDGIVDVIERSDGLIGKGLAAKHLSSLLLRFLEQKFGPDAGKPNPTGDTRTIILHESQWLELQWLASEVWESCDRVDRLVLELDEHATDISNAVHSARKAVAK